MADSVDLVHAVASSAGKRAVVADACGVGGEAAGRVLRALGDHHAATLTSLSLRQNLLSECHAGDLARLLHQATALRELALCGNALGDAALATLAQPLANHPRMAVLRMAGNPLGPRGGGALSRALQARRATPALRRLDLAATSVDDGVARLLASCIRERAAVLEALDLSFTAIRGAGVRAVAAALADAPRAGASFTLHIRGVEVSSRTQRELDRARKAWAAHGGRLDVCVAAA